MPLNKRKAPKLQISVSFEYRVFGIFGCGISQSFIRVLLIKIAHIGDTSDACNILQKSAVYESNNKNRIRERHCANSLENLFK